MKKPFPIVMLMSAFLLMISTMYVHAQEAAATAADPASADQPASPASEPAETPRVSIPPSPMPATEPLILTELRNGTPIHVRTKEEEAFDANGNKVLESSEIKEYLESVDKQISKTGSYPVHSDILYHFDKNHDGLMDRGELMSAKSAVR